MYSTLTSASPHILLLIHHRLSLLIIIRLVGLQMVLIELSALSVSMFSSSVFISHSSPLSTLSIYSNLISHFIYFYNLYSWMHSQSMYLLCEYLYSLYLIVNSMLLSMMSLLNFHPPIFYYSSVRESIIDYSIVFGFEVGIGIGLYFEPDYYFELAHYFDYNSSLSIVFLLDIVREFVCSYPNNLY